MHRKPADSRERLKQGTHSAVLDPLNEVQRDGLCDNRVPAFPIEFDPKLKQTEIEVPLRKIFLQILANLIVLPLLLRAVVELRQLKRNIMDFQIRYHHVLMIIKPENSVTGELLDIGQWELMGWMLLVGMLIDSVGFTEIWMHFGNRYIIIEAYISVYLYLSVYKRVIRARMASL